MYIETVAPEHAEGELRDLYRRGANPDGSVDAVIRMHGLSPASLRAHLELYVVALHRPSPLSRAERELVGAIVSRLDGCAYCLAHHAAGLRRLSPPERRSLADDIEAGTPADDLDLSPRERAMVGWAEKLTMRPAEMTRADADALRAAGLDDRSILDLAQVVSYFAFVNRMVLGLGVELEGPEHPRGESPSR